MSRKVMTTGFLGLVDEVTKIDKEAGRYLRNEARDLKLFSDSGAGDLSAVFVWKLSSQGHQFWAGIYSQLHTPYPGYPMENYTEKEKNK